MKYSLVVLAVVLGMLAVLAQKPSPNQNLCSVMPGVRVSEDFPFEGIVLEVSPKVTEPYQIRFLGEIVPNAEDGVGHKHPDGVNLMILPVSRRFTLFRGLLPGLAAFWLIEYSC